MPRISRRVSRKGRWIALWSALMILLMTTNNVLVGILYKWPEHPDYQDQRGPFSIHVNWHPKIRSERFPSVQERVRIYMTDWYHPPCKGSPNLGGKYHYSTIQQDNASWPILNITDPWEPSNKTKMIDSFITPDTNLFLHRPVIEDCARSREQYKDEGMLYTESRVHARWNMETYCTEMIVLMDIMDQLDKQHHGEQATPIVSYFGDGEGLQNRDSFDIPLFVKHRPVATQEQVAKVAGSNRTCMTTPIPLESDFHQAMYANRTSPILWKLSSVRHWNVLPEALEGDIPWNEKMNRAYWGGDLTGIWNRSATTDLERCQSSQRCNFVLQHAHSQLMDVRITQHRGILKNDTINGINVVGPKIDMKDVEKYKIIVSLEGNDLSSGLKWSLQSQSVVLMPPPTRTSWAMEELLEPWVHYIPMRPDGSNAEQMVQWVLDHDKEAQRIAERATLFMYDLVYHPDAESDDRMIKEEMARRYRAMWH